MNTKQGLFPTPERTLDQIVLRRTRRVFLLVSLLVVAVVILVYQDRLWQQLQAEHREKLLVRSAQIDAVVSQVIDDAISVARQNETLNTAFVASNQDIYSFRVAPAAQTSLMRELLDVAGERIDLYREISFVTPGGTIWTQVEQVNGVLRSSFAPQRNALADDPYLTESTATKSVVLTPIQAIADDGILTAYAPVTDANGWLVIGTIRVVIDADAILSAVDNSTNLEGERWLLINQAGRYLLDSNRVDSARANATVDTLEPELARKLNGQLSDFTTQWVGNQLVSGVFIENADVADMPWRLVYVEAFAHLFGRIVIGSLAILGLTLAVAWVLFQITANQIRTTLEPLKAASAMARQLATGTFESGIYTKAGDDEIGVLNQSFERISRRLADLSANLDSQIAAQRSRMENAAQISRQITAAADTGQMVQPVLERICTAFQFDQGLVFLFDDVGLSGTLAYSYAQNDVWLPRRGTAVPTDGTSIVAEVVRAQQAVVIPDRLGQEHVGVSLEPFADSIRALVGLPLRVGRTLMGAFVLQSEAPRSLSHEDVHLLQMLADQLAVALYKARQLAEAQNQMSRAEAASREQARQAWESAETRFGLSETYRYNLAQVEQTAGDPEGDIAAISAPITVRGQVIGTIAAAAPEGIPFTQNDHAVLRAVADRVGLAIESARLFHETQSSLAVTSALYQLNRQLSEATELADVIRAVADWVAPDAVSGQIWMFDEGVADDEREWLDLTASWSADGVTPETVDGVGQITLHYAVSPFLQGLQNGQVRVVNDMNRDKRLDAPLRENLEHLGGRGAVFVPFNVRGRWRGVLTMLFGDAHQFSEIEGRLYNALIDQVGVTVDNRLLIRQTEMTLDQIERLYAASRLINTAQSPDELIRAALAANKDEDLDFELGILEGPLDELGWPTVLRGVARSRNGIVYNDVKTQPFSVKDHPPLRLRDTHFTATIVGFETIFPMFSAGQPIALFRVEGHKPGALTVEDYEIYKALSGQMSTVLENQRLLDQTSMALDETTRLYSASRAINSAQDLQAVYAAAAEHLSQPTQALSRLTVLLAGPERVIHPQFLEAAYQWQRDDQAQSWLPVNTRLDARHTDLGIWIGSHSEISVLDTLAGGSSGAVDRHFAEWGTAGVIAAPLRSQQNWLGVLLVEADQPQAFSEQYIRFVQAVADQVAIAVDNRLLFEEAQTEAQRALVLAEVGQLASRVGADFEQTVRAAFERVAAAASYDIWMLMLVNAEDSERLDLVTGYSPSGMFEVAGRFYYSMLDSTHSIIDAVRMDKLLLVNDPSRYPAFADNSPESQALFGKHIAAPIHAGGKVVGALLMGRSLEEADLDEADEQLIRTLTAQISVALENRSLFDAAENERQYLRSMLETMPTGVIVLDARTLIPIQANARAEELLGRPVDLTAPFRVADYGLMRTGTDAEYPDEELPVFITAATGEPAIADDVVVMGQGGQTDLLMSAAPISDGRGGVTSIIASLQDVSNLRGLESTLQNSLREQIALYEATRALSEASTVDEALDSAIGQLAVLEPMNGYIVLLNEVNGQLEPVRSFESLETFDLPHDLFLDEPVYIGNLGWTSRLDEPVLEALKTQGIRALTCVPMRTRDIVQGWIVVLFDRTVNFTSENERFIATLADNTAVAIDNRNLLLRTEAAFEEASTLFFSSRALARVNSPQDILMAAVENLKFPSLSQAYLALPTMDRPGADLLVMGGWQREGFSGINLLGVTLNAEQFPAWSQITSPELLMYNDILDEALEIDPMERVGLESFEVRSMAVVPLKTAQRSLGVLWMVSDEVSNFSERDRRIYQSFGEQASLSMEAARLLEQAERRARQLETSAQVNQIASSILDINELLPRLVDLIRDTFKYDHVQIFLMDRADRYAELVASTGEPGRQLLEIHHKLEKGSKSVIGQVTATGQPAIALDTADASVVHRPNPFLPLTRSEMALPLMIQDRVIGALDVQSNVPNAFSEEDLRVLTTLASQISVALDNARLFEQSQNRAREMSFLFNVTTTASAADRPLAEALQSVTDLVRESLDALNVCIYLNEEYTDHFGETHTLLRAAAASGTEQPLSEISEVYQGDESNFLSIVAEGGQTLIIPDLEREKRYLPISMHARSAIAAPLIAGSQMVGVMSIESSRLDAYSIETANLLGTLTNSLSTIVQNTRLLDQVQRSNEQLRELDKIKSDFLANMSHELRTPLNSIIGFSRVILKGIDGPLTEMQEQDLTTIYNSGTHLLGLINDILDQAKISAGKMDLHPDHFDIKPVVEGVRSIGIGLVKDRPIEMRLEVAPGLPKAYGDEFRTRQVLLNLVSNACKFTKEGSVTIRVYQDSHPSTKRSMIRVDVVDTGIGIAEKDIPLLFEAFRQVDSSLTRTVGGTGLGLPIAKSLIEMQGGVMQVRSTVDVGSTFSIMLPLEPVSASASQEVPAETSSNAPTSTAADLKRRTIDLKIVTGEDNATQPHPAATPEPPPPPRDKRRTTQDLPVMPSQRTILLIEDNPDMVDHFRRSLQREGFDIFAASIPLEAEAMASGLRPTLIVMDAAFGGGASWDILSRLKARDDTQDIPVIVIALEDCAARAAAAGAFAFLQRPFMPNQLVEVVREAAEAGQIERVLIIDDQPSSARIVEEALAANGKYRIYTAHSGAEGISLVARRHPDLIILDLRMPGMDGFAVLNELRSNPETARIPIMIVTADQIGREDQEKLGDVQIIYKTDLSQENYQAFLDGIHQYLVR